jgi:hypothetical protein
MSDVPNVRCSMRFHEKVETNGEPKPIPEDKVTCIESTIEKDLELRTKARAIASIQCTWCEDERK